MTKSVRNNCGKKNVEEYNMMMEWYRSRSRNALALRMHAKVFCVNTSNRKKVWDFMCQEKRGKHKRKRKEKKISMPRPCIVCIPPQYQDPIFSSALLAKNYLAVLLRSVVVDQWTNSVPAQAVLAHDRRRDALLSYAAAVRAVAAVAATSRAAAAVAMAS